MQNIQDLQEKIFFESKNILDNLSKINSKEELLAKQDLFAELADRISFLRILEKNKGSFNIATQNIDNQFSNEFNMNDVEASYFEDSPLAEDVIEEEVIFTNELNDIDNEAEHLIDEQELANRTHLDSSENSGTTIELDENMINLPFEEEVSADNITEINLVVEQDEDDYEERISQKEKEFLESEERRRKIVEFSKAEISQPVEVENVPEEKVVDNLIDKKFKLANIKGIKAVQSLFAEETSVKEEILPPIADSKNTESGSLLKSNVPTDFMEAPKKQHEFKLDFNDKIAFTKLLFKGDETELKKTVDHLNSFQNIEEARQYLSEIYYQKDWSKVDDYAQRLWDLVESKF